MRANSKPILATGMALILLSETCSAGQAQGKRPEPEDLRTVDVSELEPVFGKEIVRAGNCEVALRNGRVLKGRLRFTGPGVITVSGGSVPVLLSDVAAIRVRKPGPSRLRKIAFGVLGGVIGLFVGAPLAFGVGVSGPETAAVAILGAMPVVGAWSAVKLVSRRGWMTILVRKGEVAPASAGAARSEPGSSVP